MNILKKTHLAQYYEPPQGFWNPVSHHLLTQTAGSSHHKGDTNPQSFHVNDACLVMSTS